MHSQTFPPHGMCWNWNPWMITAHAVSDLGTFVAYAAIPAIAMYIYRKGQLGHLQVAFPKLWLLGAMFVGTCGLSHLGTFLEVWFGGVFYWYTAANKIIMCLVSCMFARTFWNYRNDIALLGSLTHKVKLLRSTYIQDSEVSHVVPRK